MVWSRTDEAMHKIYRLLLEALDSLNANKMRSMLTILGIVIGVAAVIAMLSIGRGAEASITSSIESIGTNLVYVTAGSTSENGVRTSAGSAATLTIDDANQLAGLSNVDVVAPQTESFVQLGS
jgi:putative ABC transport system permease protein